MKMNAVASASMNAAIAALTLTGAPLAFAEPESNAEARVIQAW